MTLHSDLFVSLASGVNKCIQAHQERTEQGAYIVNRSSGDGGDEEVIERMLS